MPSVAKKPIPWRKRVVLIGGDAAEVVRRTGVPKDYQLFGMGSDPKLPETFSITIACPPAKARIMDPTWVLPVKRRAVTALLDYEDKAKSMRAEAKDGEGMTAWDP